MAIASTRPAMRWAAGLAVAAVAVVGIQALRARQPRIQPATQYYFVDLKTGRLHAAPASELPIAIDGESGRGVMAKVYSCGACDASQWKVAYIQSLTPAAEAIVSGGRPGDDDPAGGLAYSRAISDGTILAEPSAPGEQPRWLPVGSPAAIALVAGYRRQCGGSPRECLP